MATRLFGSQTSLREANRANLLPTIHKFGAMTQVELAEVTGLSTATVSTLVHQLVDEDQLETKSTVRNGRRATLVTLARHQGLGVGLWIARRHLTLSIVDFSKSIIAEYTLPQQVPGQSSWSTRPPCRWATRRTQRWNAPCCSSMRP